MSTGGKKWEKRMYYGTYHRNLDNKGRLLIPTKLAEGFEKEAFVVRGHEGCLAVYDPKGFEKYMAEYMAMNFQDPAQRAKMRIAAASVSPTKIDAAGRILLGKQLLEDYAIGEEVTLIGVFDHFEIWDKAAYARYLVINGASFDALTLKGA